MSPERAAGSAAIVFSLAGITWFAVELTPSFLGFADTDDADVMLALLRAHPWVYSTSGLLLLVMAGALIPAALGVARLVAGTHDSLAARCSAVVGCLAAAFFGLQGVFRLGGGPLLYIDGLDPDWGRAGYTAVQLVGLHGALQAAMMSLCCWAVLVSVVGATRRTLPRWLAWAAAIPALRVILLVIGPFASLPGELWVISILTIPLTVVWCGVLGVVLVARRRRGASALAAE